MGRQGLPAGEGLLLSPAPSIHTAFMRFDIDAVFLDRDLRVLRVAEGVRPWRLAWQSGARSVLELPALEASRRGLEVGHRLELREREPDEPPPDTRRAGETAPGASESGRLEIDGGPLSSESIIWPVDLRDDRHLVALSPMRVLVVSEDRQFRSSTMMLLAHRGCSVTTTGNVSRAAKLVARDEVEVVVLDAGQAAADEESMAPAFGVEARAVGVVIVSEEQSSLDRHPPVLHKWGSFDTLFAAVQRAANSRGGKGAAA